ncbi:MAG: hypothetical protein M1820_008114 [Bogoriella megaspora]|nr:MAG: hypothetical protein M1820_008114 [Bogoriella megaspora]
MRGAAPAPVAGNGKRALPAMMNADSESVRWQAVVKRDRNATNFVYAVRTTKIYCRPSCAARLARRANIAFFNTSGEAEAAGFRPCKRCLPQDENHKDPQTKLVRAACEAIESSSFSARAPTLRVLAKEAKLTPNHFHRVFKKVTGLTPGQYRKQKISTATNGPEHQGDLEALGEDWFNDLFTFDTALGSGSTGTSDSDLAQIMTESVGNTGENLHTYSSYGTSQPIASASCTGDVQIAPFSGLNNLSGAESVNPFHGLNTFDFNEWSMPTTNVNQLNITSAQGVASSVPTDHDTLYVDQPLFPAR